MFEPGVKYDFTGQKIGRLTVIEYSTRYGRWMCRCECGEQLYRTTTKLRQAVSSASNTSCVQCRKKRASPYSPELLERIRMRRGLLYDLGIWRQPNEEGVAPPLKGGDLNHLLGKPRYQQPFIMGGQRAYRLETTI